MTSVQRVQEWFEAVLGLTPDVQWRLLVTVLVVLGMALVRALVSRLVIQRIEDVRTRYRTGRALTTATALVTLAIVVRIWSESLAGMATFLGLLSAGLALALREPIVSIFGYLYIIARKPFEIGDRIEVGPHAGDVVDIRYFRFALLEIGKWVEADQSTGRVLHVPNSQVFTVPVANYTREFPFIWDEIALDVTFESDWRKMKRLMEGAATRHCPDVDAEMRRRIDEASRNMLIVYSTLTPRVWTRVVPHGVRLTLRFLCEARRRRGTEELLWEDLLEHVAVEPSVEIAYPTTRFFDRSREGKSTSAVGPAHPRSAAVLTPSED